MKRPTALGVIIPALAIGLLTVAASGVFAQDPPKGGGERPAAGGGQAAGGGAGPRNEGGAVSRGGDGAPPSAGSGSSGGGSSWGGGAGNTRSSGDVATPRGPGWNGRNSGNDGSFGAAREARPRDAAGGFRRPPTDDQASGRLRSGGGDSSSGMEVPWYSRSRSGNPSTGTAANRGEVPVISPPGGGGYYPGYPGYGYPGYGYPGYGNGYYSGYNNCYYGYYGGSYNCYGNPWGYGGFGLGYLFYDPYGWSYGSYGYGGYGGGYGGGGGLSPQPTGSIRLKVKPNTASVYVDGYYAGRVDDFDGAFQKLAIALGVHKIEISAPGYRPLIVEVNIQDWNTMTHEGRLEPIR